MNTVMLAFFERPRRLHRAQRRDDHRDPALVVARARAVGPVAVADPVLERRIRLEHRIEVGDQEQPLALSAPDMARDQVPGAVRRAHVDPLGGEAERRNSGATMSRDRLDAALFIVPLFRSTQRSSIASVRSCSESTVADHRLLGPAERGGRRLSEKTGGKGEREQEL